MPKLETKFELGQTVYAITSMRIVRKVHCITCNSTGKVTINKEEFVCPKCSGVCKQDEYTGHKWVTGNIGQVRYITVNFSDKKYLLHDTSRKEDGVPNYILNATSGALYKETDLFATKDQAQEACDIRNADTNWEDDK